MDCCRCFLPIHDDAPKDYLGDRVAHRHTRCVELLRAKLAELKEENENNCTALGIMNVAAANLESQLADRDAEIERLWADLVWAVRKGVMVSHDENLRPCVWFDVHRGVECDGTPESICRAVREARTNVVA